MNNSVSLSHVTDTFATVSSRRWKRNTTVSSRGAPHARLFDGDLRTIRLTLADGGIRFDGARDIERAVQAETTALLVLAGEATAQPVAS
ncbi:hypothetical protein [Natronorubrum halophilum]|uniref:hypothetical protein n=1 Tax=Natronorubrum halophilum TaxID=1702106 RepID=UPI000EF752D0|nr:hypothetical protein [Natronorubrum halophilum]